MTLTATPAAGWTFAGWSGDLTGSTNPQTITIDANKVVTATFTTTTTLFSDDFTRQPRIPTHYRRGPASLAPGRWRMACCRGRARPISMHSLYYSPLPAWTDYTVQARFQFPAGAFGGGIGGRL